MHEYTSGELQKTALIEILCKTAENFYYDRNLLLGTWKWFVFTRFFVAG